MYSVCTRLTQLYLLVDYKVLVGKPEGKRPLGRPRRSGWIILGWISRRWDVGTWTGLGWPRLETGGGSL